MTSEQPVNIFAPGFKFLREIKHDYTKFVYFEWSPDGNILALGPDVGSYALWYSETAKFEFRRVGDGFAGPDQVTWSPDGQRIAIACQADGLIQIQTLANPITESNEWNKWRTRINTFPPYDQGGAEGEITDILWTPNGKHLITAHRSRDVIMWNLETTEVLQRFRASPRGPWVKIAVSPDGRFLTSNDQEKLQIRTINSFEDIVAEIKPQWEWFDFAEITKVDWSANGKLIAIADLSDNIHIIDVQSWKSVHKLKAPEARIIDLKFSPDSKFLASTGADNIFRMWNCDNWKLKIQVPDLIDGFSGRISFHPNQLIIGTSAKGKVKLWEYQPHLLS